MGEATLQDWVGRTQVLTDTITPAPARALAATLNRLDLSQLGEGDAIQPLWSWLYFLPLAPSSQIGPDGHPKRGGFLPPIELPRRMWAGSRCRFHAPLRIGDAVERTSTIAKVSEKAGKAGTMVFVTVRHALTGPAGLVMEEEQDIVFLAIPDRFAPPEPTTLPPCDWREEVAVDPVLLFRFSALTFNGHRIHYDRNYASEVERYPGLVVHGPLQAVLLFDAATRHSPDRAPVSFDFRGLRPLFDFDAVSLNGQVGETGGLQLYTANADGAVGMSASLAWAAS